MSPSKSFVKKNADPKPHIHLSHFSSGDGLDEFVVFQAFTCCDLWLVTCKWQNPYCLVSSDWILGSFLWVQIREVFTGLVTLDGTSSACGVGGLNLGHNIGPGNTILCIKKHFELLAISLKKKKKKNLSNTKNNLTIVSSSQQSFILKKKVPNSRPNLLERKTLQYTSILILIYCPGMLILILYYTSPGRN